MLDTVLGDIEVGFIDASTLESRVVVSDDISNFASFRCIFLEIRADWMVVVSVGSPR